jgi:multiple sugar transport system substrate-binding protein
LTRITRHRRGRKRFRTVLFALLLLGVGSWAVTGCGGGDDNGGNATASSGGGKKLSGQVRLWVMNNGPDPVADTEKIVAPFEKQTGVDVKVQLVGWDVQFDRIRNAAVSGKGPDVTQAGTTQVPFFAALGGFDDLSGRVNDIGGESAYAPGVWQTTQVSGQDGDYAVPWFTEARSIYYRKDLLKKAGIDPKTAFTDWDALRATLEKLKSSGAVDNDKTYAFGLPGKKAFDLVHHVMPFVWDAGGAELNSDATKSTINSSQSQQGVDFVADLIHDGLADPTALEKDGQQVEDSFKGGRLAVWIGGPWVLATIPRKDDDVWAPQARNNVGTAPMPAGPSGKAYTFVGGSNLMMFKSSQNKDAAWALIKFLSQDATQTAYAGLMGMFPARLDPQKAAGEKDANYAGFYKAIQNGRTYAPIPQWGQVETAYKTRFGNILDMAAGHGKEAYSPDAVAKELDEAAKEADTLLAQKAG